MLLIIDNYDSFTYNLYQRIGEIDGDIETRVIRNDKITVDEIAGLKPERIIISPGPCTPLQAGISNDVVKSFAGKIPILGVCLGHQCIAHAFGGKIVRADRLMHGKTSEIRHDGSGVFKNVANPFTATRYHSLAVDESTLGDQFEISARSVDRGELMALRHKSMAVEGVQFHPESFLTEAGYRILENFLSY